MLLCLAATCFAFVSRASSQSTTIVEILPLPTSCSNSFLDANATGSAYIGLSSVEEPFTWVYSVSDNTSNTAFGNLWLGTPSGISVYDVPDDYGICTIQLTLPQNTIERGQMDNGSCEQALDPTCVDVLISAVEFSANQLLHNLVSVPVMPLFCQQIVPALVVAAQSADCKPYFYNQSNTHSNSVSFGKNPLRRMPLAI